MVGACHSQEGYDHIKGELMRIFGDKGKKREKKSCGGERRRHERNQDKNNEWVFCVRRKRTLG